MISLSPGIPPGLISVTPPGIVTVPPDCPLLISSIPVTGEPSISSGIMISLSVPSLPVIITLPSLSFS